MWYIVFIAFIPLQGHLRSLRSLPLNARQLTTLLFQACLLPLVILGGIMLAISYTIHGWEDLPKLLQVAACMIGAAGLITWFMFGFGGQ